MGVGAAALISVIALSNVSGESGLTYIDHFNAESLNHIQRSYIWIRAIKFLWLFCKPVCMTIISTGQKLITSSLRETQAATSKDSEGPLQRECYAKEESD